MLLAFIDEPLLIGLTEGDTIPDLSGSMFVNNTEAVDELLIKNKINAAFPKLNIFFANVKPAISGKSILPDFDDNGVYLGTYSYVSDGQNEDARSVQKIAPTSWFSNPYTTYKPEKPNYDFLGWSSSMDKLNLISSATATKAEQDSAWLDHRPNGDLVGDFTFYALFEKHKYEMEFFNNGQLFDKFTVLYGEPLENSTKLPSYTDSSLDLEETYRFIGWSESASQMIVNSVEEVKLVNFEQMRSVKNYKFYACYIKENVHKNATNLSLFEFANHNGLHGSGLCIRPKANVILSGKVTLPVKYNGQPIRYIDRFYN
jgi:hypothetical protein